MKTSIKHFCITAILLGAVTIHAQQRFGGGFGGFGGFGGGGFGNANRGGTTTSSYNNNGSVGTATISVDPQTHNIIVSADEITAEQISNVLANLDIPKPQVLIKVAFVEVQRNDDYELGVQGAYTGVDKHFSQITGFMTNFTVANPGTPANPIVGGSGIATIVPSSITPTYQSFNLGNGFNLPQTLAGATGNGGLYQVLGSDFTVTVQALAAAGKAQVISRPSIMARDGQLAEIVVGQSIYLPSGVSFTSIGSGDSTVPTINGSYQNVGIQLDVTPFIGANNLIEMILEPQITAIDTSTPGQQIVGSSLFSGAVFAPNINKRSANTVVITPDAQPVVIGGLISNDKSSNVSKVPILGDIPLFGALFRYTAKSTSRTELIMFLTPHIVRAPSQLAQLGISETHQTEMITNSISEQELNRLIDRLPVKKNQH